MMNLKRFKVNLMACEFRNELLNFATNVRTSQQTSECCSEKLAEIDNNILQNLKLIVTEFKWFTCGFYLVTNEAILYVWLATV